MNWLTLRMADVSIGASMLGLLSRRSRSPCSVAEAVRSCGGEVMLRITIHDDPDSVTFLLEGKLAGSWVQELEDCWQSTVVCWSPTSHPMARSGRPAARKRSRAV